MLLDRLPSLPVPAHRRLRLVPILITIVGPIAAGKNTVADLIAARCEETGRTVVVADVDDVAWMLRPPARRGELWLDAHKAHARYRSLRPGIPVDLTFDSSRSSAAEIADAICRAVGLITA